MFLLPKFKFSQLIAREVQGQVGIITLNNEKKRNTFSKETLSQLFENIQSFKEQKVLIIKAKGPVFSTGHDLKELLSSSQEENLEAFKLAASICQSIRSSQLAVIAQVQGLATAAGCQVVLSADIITATPHSSFATPGLKVGLFCSTPGVELARALPQSKKALEMLLTAEPITSKEALSLGMINHVFEDNEIDGKTLEIADKIAHYSGQSIAFGKKQISIEGKRIFYEQVNQPYKQAYETTTKAMVDNLKFSDAQEGLKAFTEKRKPEFKY